MTAVAERAYLHLVVPDVEEAPLPPPRVCKVSPEEQRKATDTLLVRLRRCTNPRTGQIYTLDELAELFHLHPRTVEKKFREHDIYTRPLPEVRHGELPLNQKAFFVGLAQGRLQVERVNWSRTHYVMVGTESDRPEKRELLKTTVGTWGEIHEGQDELRIYVDPERFDFMLDPRPSARFLNARSRFSPFLMGALVARLSNVENRLTLNDDSTLQRVYNGFINHFGFSIGNIIVRNDYPNGQEGPDANHGHRLIRIHQPEAVFGVLLGEESVTSLPFLKDVARLSPR